MHKLYIIIHTINYPQTEKHTKSHPHINNIMCIIKTILKHINNYDK